MMEDIVLPISSNNQGRSRSNSIDTYRKYGVDGYETDRQYLTQSLEDISRFRAKYSSRITEEQRMELTLNELGLVKKEVELKSISTQYKATVYHILNTLFSLIILIGSGVIVGLESVSECMNIPVIVISSIIFILEGLHKMFRWGPQGVKFKTATIQLRRIQRQARDYMYTFHKYNADQILGFVSQLRARYDDIDIGLYTTSMSGAARYNGGGLDIEQGGGNIGNNIPRNSMGAVNLTQQSPAPDSHVHIHIDTNENSASTPVLDSNYHHRRTHSDNITNHRRTNSDNITKLNNNMPIIEISENEIYTTH